MSSASGSMRAPLLALTSRLIVLEPVCCTGRDNKTDRSKKVDLY